MARIPHLDIAAPTGMDMTSDPYQLAPNRAQQITNLLFDQPGKLRGSIQASTVLSLPYSPDGVGWWYGSTPSADRMLVVMNGYLYTAIPTVPPTYTESFTGLVQVGTRHPFAIGKRVRFASYLTRTIMVQDGGIQPQQFDGTHLYQLGISAPAQPAVGNAAHSGSTPNDGGPGMSGGNYQFLITYQDASGNESSPSAATLQTITAGNDAHVSWVASADPQVAFVNVYVSPPGSAVFYRDGQVAIASGLNFYVQNVDNVISATTLLAPNPGENDIPSFASVVATHKDHVFLNDTTNASILQVSNLNNPTLWSTVTLLPGDGERIVVSSDQGDPVQALVPFGSLLGVWKRREFYQLWGDTVTDFTVRGVHLRGCIAPDSAVRCDNVLMFLSDDGFYQASFDNGFLLQKVSKEMEAYINSFVTKPNGRANLELAWASYCNNRYYCGIVDPISSATIVTFYDFDAQGWGQLAFQ